MTKEQFTEKYYDTIKEYMYREGEELGYSKNQLEAYWNDTKCFIFIGTKDELKDEFKGKLQDISVIAEEENYFAVETFSGIEYDCI